MSNTTPNARRLARPDLPFNPGRRHRASFARAALSAEFGRHGFAIDQADFIDRKPWEKPKRAPDAGFE